MAHVIPRLVAREKRTRGDAWGSVSPAWWIVVTGIAYDLQNIPSWREVPRKAILEHVAILGAAALHYDAELAAP